MLGSLSESGKDDQDETKDVLLNHLFLAQLEIFGRESCRSNYDTDPPSVLLSTFDSGTDEQRN